MNKVKLAAHRGFLAKYPENTMRAYKEAVKLDIDMLEIDLHMTKDGEIVMMHDHLVDRTTNGTGYVRDKTLAEIRELDAGSWKGEEFKGEKVPTFIEFLEWIKDYPDIEVNVELKDYPRDVKGDFPFVSADKSIALLEKYGMSDRIYINCWSGEVLMYIANKYHDKYRLHGYYPLFLNHGNFDKEHFYERLFCVCLFNQYLDENGVKQKREWPVMEQSDFDFVRSQGCEPWVHFPPLDKYEWDEDAVKKGAVGFTCNDPEEAGKFLDKIGARPLKKD